MIAAISSEAIGSARRNPVTRMMPPAIAVAMNAARSVTMCLNDPSMFMDCRLAFESV